MVTETIETKATRKTKTITDLFIYLLFMYMHVFYIVGKIERICNGKHCVEMEIIKIKTYTHIEWGCEYAEENDKSNTISFYHIDFRKRKSLQCTHTNHEENDSSKSLDQIQ